MKIKLSVSITQFENKFRGSINSKQPFSIWTVKAKLKIQKHNSHEVILKQFLTIFLKKVVFERKIVLINLIQPTIY